MSNKFWVLVPIGMLVLLVSWEYHYRPRFEFVANDVSVTIPEGTNIADIDRLIREAGIILASPLLASENLALEGVLFPDTYRFDRSSTAEDIIVRMKKEYADRETLIIASLLEEEVQTDADMRIVAGIIQKRLAAGMPLQIDASVAYGACLPRFNLGKYCDVTQVNLVDNIKRDSPYNTYTRVGLPVGPISNPGSRALSAAEHPQTSGYWYYLSTPQGMTIFSKTLQEHNRAHNTYY